MMCQARELIAVAGVVQHAAVFLVVLTALGLRRAPRLIFALEQVAVLADLRRSREQSGDTGSVAGWCEGVSLSLFLRHISW